MENKEIELKYKIDYEKADGLSVEIMDFLSLPSLTEKKMKAIYYDTLENDLLKNHIAFRIRKEGQETYATIKSKGTYDKGTFSRQEWNQNISHQKNFEIKDVLLNMECGENLKDIIKDKCLISRMTSDFTRRKTKIALSDSLIELAIDKGEIITVNGKENLCELELELLHGSQACLEAFGSALAQRFNLKPEPVSKYARGLRLLGLEVKV